MSDPRMKRRYDPILTWPIYARLGGLTAVYLRHIQDQVPTHRCLSLTASLLAMHVCILVGGRSVCSHPLCSYGKTSGPIGSTSQSMVVISKAEGTGAHLHLQSLAA